MKLTVKKLLISLGVYIVLWGLSWSFSGSALKRQIYREAKADYDEHFTKPGVPPPTAPNGTHPYPIAEVRLLCCPFPGVFRAEHERVIGPLNGFGAESWFVWTPWRVYEIYTYRETVWVSWRRRPVRSAQTS